jgi:hypothetical protein
MHVEERVNEVALICILHFAVTLICSYPFIICLISCEKFSFATHFFAAFYSSIYSNLLLTFLPFALLVKGSVKSHNESPQILLTFSDTTPYI